MKKQQEGFTLVEVVASIVIISIILLGFSSIFITSNKTANTNTEKIVVTNLADAQLERLKIKKITSTTCPFTPIKETLTVNGKTYQSEASQNCAKAAKDTTLKLKNVIVTVTAPDGKTKGVVEGYVPAN